MTAQHAAPRRRWHVLASLLSLAAWLRAVIAGVELRLAWWNWPVAQWCYRREFKRADRKAFRAEMAAANTGPSIIDDLADLDDVTPQDSCAVLESPAQAPRPGDPPRVAARDVVRAGANPTPAASAPVGVPEAPAPAAGAEAPVPATPPGPGTSPGRDTWVIAPPSGRHVTASPRAVPVDDTVPLRRVPAQRTATAPNPVYRPLPLVRVPPWLVILRDDHGVERYRMADARRYLRARNAARTATG